MIEWFEVKVKVNESLLDWIWKAVNLRRVDFTSDAYLRFHGDPVPNINVGDGVVTLTWSSRVEACYGNKDLDVKRIEITKDQLIAHFTVGTGRVLFERD
jgi:hypothetical protein